MTRATLTSAARAAATGPVVRMGELIDIAFPSGTIYATSGDRPVVFNGNTYVTTFVVMDPVSGYTESSDNKARRISIKLGGMDAGLKTKILNDAYSFAVANVYLAFYDANWNLVSTYLLAGNQQLSNITLTLGAGTAEMELSCEGPQILDNRDSAVLSSPETQRIRYPGDAGLDNVSRIAGTQVEWGGKVEAIKGGRGHASDEPRNRTNRN